MSDNAAWQLGLSVLIGVLIATACIMNGRINYWRSRSRMFQESSDSWEMRADDNRMKILDQARQINRLHVELADFQAAPTDEELAETYASLGVELPTSIRKKIEKKQAEKTQLFDSILEDLNSLPDAQ